MSDPIRLIALATELEKEGQYNAAKLLRAAAGSLINRGSTEVAVSSDAAIQAAELETISASLESSPAAALSEPIRAAARSLRSGTVPLYRDAADPFVCRICGEVRLAPFDGRCSHCGRWPDAAERFRPIYWARASTPPEALALLAATPVVVGRILEAGPTDVPGPDGGWSAHQTLEHLHNAQSVFRGRIDQLIGGGEPELASVMVWKMDGASASTGGLFEQYVALREEIIGLLASVPPEAWWHTGRHEEFGVVTLAEQASYFANHEPTHLAQLADAAGWV